MQLIDTHTHIYLSDFDDDRREMIRRAMELGVERFYLPNIDDSSVEAMLQLETEYPDSCFAMMGLHPCSVKENWKEALSQFETWLNQRSFAGVGEVGLDYYWDKTFIKEQKEAFSVQIGWARSLQIPVVIHSRDALGDCIDIIRQFQDGKLKGVFHCYSGSAEDAKRITDLGFYLGIGGVLTYKNCGLRQSLRTVARDMVVLETDAPYLTPVPYRGKRNEPAYLKEIVEVLADVWEENVEITASRTSSNALKLFGG
jgi:TatD DNase family protein